MEVASKSTSLLAGLLLTLLVLPITGQDAAGPPTLEQVITPNLRIYNEPSVILFPIPVLLSQTPLQVRYTMVFALASREVMAACDPTALSFFGTKDAIPKAMCEPTEFAIVLSFTIRKALMSDYPVIISPYTAFLVRQGLIIDDGTANMTTPAGWGNMIGGRMATFLKNDGWNSMGVESSSYFPKPFSDTTGYRPKNDPEVEPSDLRFPLRWQPLTQAYDVNGNYANQVHVTPHIGKTVRPLLLSAAEFDARRAPHPYERKSQFRGMTDNDTMYTNELLEDVISHSSRMSERKLATAAFWDNKFYSLGIFLIYYANRLNLSEIRTYSMWCGEALAQHDSVLVAWKEKIRHDVVRPITLLRRQYRGKNITVWRGFGNGVGEIAADEWEPALRTMPHSEYPSASSILCKASMDAIENFVLDEGGYNATTVPPFSFDIVPGFVPNNPVQRNFTIQHATLRQAAEECGRSRLWTGLHFAPAVLQGRKLGVGLGKRGFKTIKSLDQGTVPKNCHWCTV